MLQTEGAPESVICVLVFSPARAAVADAAVIFRVNLAQCLVGPAALGTPAVLTHCCQGSTGAGGARAVRDPGDHMCSRLVSGSPQAAAPGARVNLAPGPPARLGRGRRKAKPSSPQAGDSILPGQAQRPFISGAKPW